MSLRKFLNVVSYTMAPTLDAQEALARQLADIEISDQIKTPNPEMWGIGPEAQSGLDAMMAIGT